MRDTRNRTRRLKSRAKREKITCARATCASGLSVVFTPPVAYQGIAIACRRKTFTCKKQNTAHTTLMTVTMKQIATTQTLAIPRKESLLLVSVVPLPACLWIDALRTFVVPSKWLVSLRSNLFSTRKSVVVSECRPAKEPKDTLIGSSQR